MYSCYQTVGTCYPPPGLKKQGQVQAMRIGRKTKGPARLALKIIVATVLERGLWPRPLLRLSRFFLLLFCCSQLFFWNDSRDLRHVGMLLFNRNHIKCKHTLNVWCSGFLYLINKIPFNVGIKNKKKEAVWRRVYKLVRAKLGALEKLWFVGFFFLFFRG